MPLSDHEKRLLAEMEAALESEDPRLVSTMTGKVRTRTAGRLLLGAVLSLVGMAIILAGLIAQIVLVGILGFLVALAGLVLVFSNLSLGGEAGNSRPNGTKGPKTKWSARLEDRWERRNFDQ